MGRGDNRRTRKVVQRSGQAKKKARLKKRAGEAKAQRQGTKQKARA
jgi:hypothetical protein